MRLVKSIFFIVLFLLAGFVSAGDLEKADSLYDAGKYEEALLLYLKPPFNNEAYVQNRIGLIYRNVDELRNIEKSIEWYSKAAEQGLAQAQYNLGISYVNGIGVEKDYVRAMALFQKAADQSLPAAYTGIGMMYDEGLGVKQNKRKAAQWFLKAANKGSTAAQCNLAYMLTFGESVKKDYKEARKALNMCLKKEPDNICCLDRMADTYFYGWGVKKDYVKANELHRHSAALGSGIAMFSLGTAYDYGFGVEKNAATALQWYEKGAATGEARSLYRLYEIHEYGRLGQPIDKAKAKAWLARAEPAMKEQNITRNAMKDQLRLMMEE